MDHDWAMSRIVGTHKIQVKSLGQIEIELDRAQLMKALQSVLHIEIDFRTVKCAIAFVDLVGTPKRIQRSFESGFGLIPKLVRSHALCGTRRKINLHIGKSKKRIGVQNHLSGFFHLAFDLIGRAENMGVVLAECSHARESAHDARAFVAVKPSEICNSQRQVSI